jgi:hypothetical protein
VNFTVSHSRAFSGNDLSIKVAGSGDEDIATVTVTYDGFDLEEQELPPSTVSYERIFPQAGQAGPGTDHTLEVVVRDHCGKAYNSVTCWKDTQ